MKELSYELWRGLTQFKTPIDETIPLESINSLRRWFDNGDRSFLEFLRHLQRPNDAD